MEKLLKPLAILNLAEELGSEFTEYFTSRGIEVSTPDDNHDRDWTHIITKDVHEFDHLNTVYDLTEKDRFIISLSKVSDLKNFTINNGNLILDEGWFSNELGPFIMDKYLQGYGGINLGDNYPTFEETGSFNVANPLNTGEYLDRMVQKAFEHGSEALSVKTYFDHLVMYIAGLKNQGKAGLPLEVTYGNFNEVFGVQVHFFAQNLNIMDFSTSLSSSISKKPEEYLLNIAVQASDFFDFSYLPEVNKVIITAMWTKDERIKFENRGFMFTAINGNAPLIQYQSSEPTSSLISLSGGILEKEISEVLTGEAFEEDQSSELVKGSGELEELIQTIKGKLDEDKSVFKVAGEKLDIDKTSFRIASTINDTAKEQNMSVKSLGSSLQSTIKTGLFDFAKNLNKDVEDLEDQDIEQFQTVKIPELLTEQLEKKITIKESSRVADKASMSVKSLGIKAADSSNPEAVKEMQNQLMTANAENEKLRSQLKTVVSEVKILKDSRNKMAEMQAKAQAAASEINLQQAHENKVDNEKHDLINKLHQKLDDQEAQKFSSLLDNMKQEELKVRRLQLEAVQKDTFFSQQLEKSEREIKSKDLIIIKTKETFTKLIDKKEREVSDLKSKIEQLSKALVSGPTSNQNQMLKDLDKQNQNLSKQIEMYKNKISSMATNLQASKSEDTLKDEARKLQMLNQQMKNQLDQSKRELDKLQTKSASDSAQLLQLKQEKAKLEQLLKKAALEAKASTAATQAPQADHEMRRLQAQNQVFHSSRE